MGDQGCKWVRDRLPLLAGGELLGLDRRRVERHLIGCPSCRLTREAHGQALDVLHAAAAQAPSRPDAPSLWPALARQIRESRRPAPVSSLSWPRFVLWPAFGLGFGLLMSFAVAVVTGQPSSRAPRVVLPKSRPAIVRTPVRTVAPPPAPVMLTLPSVPVIPEGETSLAEAAAPRFDFDLDHGSPMPPEVRDASQPTY
jgi:anti-sigma factor RsiW